MTEQNCYISIVSPVYMAENIVDELVKRIMNVIEKITNNYEIVLVEDGSPDRSWEKIEENCKVNNQVKGIKLSRNFGQHYAITAGLNESSGDYVVVMDCDLQDNPNYIPDLLKKSKEGYDIVYTVKKDRRHPIVKNIFAILYHRIFNYLVKDKSLRGSGRIGSFSLLSRKVVDVFCNIGDYHRQYLPLLHWVGFTKAYYPVVHEERYEGQSSYNLKKLIELAIDGILSNSEKLLYISIYIGFSFALLGFLSILYITIKALISGFQPGWASLTVLIIFSTGLILISLGIIGIYIGKILEQSKGRPQYIIEKRINCIGENLHNNGKEK